MMPHCKAYLKFGKDRVNLHLQFHAAILFNSNIDESHSNWAQIMVGHTFCTMVAERMNHVVIANVGMYVGDIWFIFHVLQLLLIQFMQ